MKNEWIKERWCENWDIWKVELFRINYILVSVDYMPSSAYLAYGKYNGNEWKSKQTDISNSSWIYAKSLIEH